MNLNKMYLVAVDNKKLLNWKNEMCKKLKRKSKVMLDDFEKTFPEMFENGNHYSKTSFVAFWEMKTDDSLARMATAITQATFVTMLQRLFELNKLEEIAILNSMQINFMRILAGMGTNEEE